MAKVWRAEFGGHNTVDSLEWMFTMHYQTDMGTGSGEPSASRVLEEILDHYGTTATNINTITGAVQASNVFTFARVREETEPGSGDLPEQAGQTLAAPGLLTFSGSDRLPTELCMWMKLITAVSSRSSRGGFHLPPAVYPPYLNASGFWDAATISAAPFSTLADAVKDTLDDVFGEEIGNGSLRPIIYSRTRRARGQSPWTFNVTDADIDGHTRWLRRRGTAP